MNRRWIILTAVLLAALAVGLYSPALRAEFVYDDVSQIVIDDYIHDPANIPEVLSFRVLGRDELDYNRPVMLLSMMVDSLIWNRQPFGYHLTSLLMHAACTVLLFTLLLRILPKLLPSDDQAGRLRVALGSLIAAVIFAVHPANSEAVCVPSFREDLLVALFILIGLHLAERFPAAKRWQTYLIGGACTFCMLLAVGSKETGAIAPALLTVYWLCFGDRSKWRAWAGLVGVVTLVIGAFLIARFAMQVDESSIFVMSPRYLGGSFAAAMRIQPSIWVHQFGNVIWPDKLCADQTVELVERISLGVAIVGLVAAMGVLALSAWKNRAVAFGLILFWLAILPVSNLVPMYRPIADRYMYLPMIGLCVVLGAWLCRAKWVRLKWQVVGLLIGGAVVCTMLGVVTARRVSVWQSSMSLWQDTVERNEHSDTGYNNLGFALYEEARYVEAIDAFRQASRLSPGMGDCFAGAAITLDAMGKPEAAERALKEAIRRQEFYSEPDRLVAALIWQRHQADKLQLIADRLEANQADQQGLK